jgi:hypothetical protein
VFLHSQVNLRHHRDCTFTRGQMHLQCYSLSALVAAAFAVLIYEIVKRFSPIHHRPNENSPEREHVRQAGLKMQGRSAANI